MTDIGNRLFNAKIVGESLNPCRVEHLAQTGIEDSAVAHATNQRRRGGRMRLVTQHTVLERGERR